MSGLGDTIRVCWLCHVPSFKRCIKYSWEPQQNGAPARRDLPAVMPSVHKSLPGNCLQMQEKLRGILDCVNMDFCKTKNSHSEESKVTALPARPLPPSVRIKDSRQTNFSFFPLLFLQGKSPRDAHYFTNIFVVHKNQIHSPVCNTPVRHRCSLQGHTSLVVPRYSTNKAPRLSKLLVFMHISKQRN